MNRAKVAVIIIVCVIKLVSLFAKQLSGWADGLLFGVALVYLMESMVEETK